MHDTTSYVANLPASLNQVLQTFTGGACVMVRKAKTNNQLLGRSGNCHLNVQNCIGQYGGVSVSGWLLNREPKRQELGMFVWSFHSVWEQPDGKWLDVTNDKHYVGRDKSIFVPDNCRKPDMVQGICYNNFAVFTNPALADYWGKSVNKSLIADHVYWCDSSTRYLLDVTAHNGEYRLLINYPQNQTKLGNEHGIDYIGGKIVPRPNCPYIDVVPVEILFSYNLRMK